MCNQDSKFHTTLWTRVQGAAQNRTWRKKARSSALRAQANGSGGRYRHQSDLN